MPLDEIYGYMQSSHTSTRSNVLIMAGYLNKKDLAEVQEGRFCRTPEMYLSVMVFLQWHEKPESKVSYNEAQLCSPPSLF